MKMCWGGVPEACFERHRKEIGYTAKICSIDQGKAIYIYLYVYINIQMVYLYTYKYEYIYIYIYIMHIILEWILFF